MKVLRQTWARLQIRYSALLPRERLLVAATLVLAPLLLGHSVIVAPYMARIRSLEQDVARQTASVAEFQSQFFALQQKLQADPNVGPRAELAALKGERDGLDKQLQQFGNALVRPEEMNGLLEGLLKRNAGLRLVSLKTLAPQSVLRELALPDGDKKMVERTFDLYRHGVEIRLEGRFGDLETYLGQLEKLPQRLLWGNLNYQVVEHPRAEMTLTVYTLSPERTWLAL